MQKADYRVRKARVAIHNGWNYRYDFRWMGERRITCMGRTLFWWPVINGDWRGCPEQAQLDIEDDMRLRHPIGSPQLYAVTNQGEAP